MRLGIAVENLSVQYALGDTQVQALQGINLTVAPGEFLAIVGESGCGKTTLLRAIGGLQQPTQGGVTIGDVPVTGPSESIAWVFQRPTLLEWRTVMENVLLPAELGGRPSAQAQDLAARLLQMTGLAGFEKSYPRQLSGGMQQRVSLARALVREPGILLLDEPFSALDALTREQMHLELLSIWHRTGATVVFITHDIQEAAFLADRVVLMSPRPGRMVGEFRVPLHRPREAMHRFSDELVKLCRTVRTAMEDAVTQRGRKSS